MPANRYGQTITWGTTAAPQLCTGVRTAYSYRESAQRMFDDNESAQNEVVVLHGRKAALSFSAKVRAGSTDFLDLSSGKAAITVSTINTGVVLATRAVERWRLLQPKVVSIEATHFPDMSLNGGQAADVTLDAFTPDQAALSIIQPGGVIIWGTYGMTHGSGKMHAMTIEQNLQIFEDDEDPAGTILGAATGDYFRTLSLELLATGAGPAIGSTLALTGAPSHAQDYLVESCETIFADKRGKMLQIGAVWIDPLSS